MAADSIKLQADMESGVSPPHIPLLCQLSKQIGFIDRPVRSPTFSTSCEWIGCLGSATRQRNELITGTGPRRDCCLCPRSVFGREGFLPL